MCEFDGGQILWLISIGCFILAGLGTIIQLIYENFINPSPSFLELDYMRRYNTDMYTARNIIQGKIVPRGKDYV